ncbi:MAG: tetratricopeptide repeat protein [Pseudanabaenaceae cyanobacterium bins.39]|nr:tetratricopeptide repeat protein [Pseudanabaenaceae cyanobacterium bins.39]
MANKGFGGAKSGSSQSAKQFILKFQKYWEKNPDLKKAHQFFSSHLSELNESLLKSLPSIFRDLTKDKTSQEQYPIAVLFGNFGTVIRDFPLGDRALSLEFSITALQLILKVFTRSFYPEEWADTQNNLGNAYSDRIRGERADNIEQAIASYELALQVRTRDAFPEKWAMTKNNLGITYSDRIRGERADNIEQAIACYELALQVRTRDAFPEKWAGTQNNLGTAYSDRIRGERADNIEQAIAAYELALQVRTRDTFPEQWAGTQQNLGAAYSNRIRGERADNIEQAITAYELALQVYTRDAFPEKWAGTQNNLAAAYWNRIRGERADNIEQSIIYLQLALQVYTRAAFPEDWAQAQENLGTAYRDRICGERADNLEQAIYLYNQAAQIFTRESYPQKWSTNQAHLAEAFIKRAELTNSCTDLDTAIELLQSSLELAVVGCPDYIDTNYRLGNALSRRYEHTKNAAELEQAMQAYKIALDAISPEHYDRKQIWQALPTTQVILGSRLVQEGEWLEGLQMLLNSLTQLSTGDDPLAHANALYQTGRAYEVMSNLDKARLYYRDALRLYDHLQDNLGVIKSRAGLGSVLVSQGHLEKGINELDQAREGYLKLQKSDQVHDLDNIYQAAQRALERQSTEVY